MSRFELIILQCDQINMQSPGFLYSRPLEIFEGVRGPHLADRGARQPGLCLYHGLSVMGLLPEPTPRFIPFDAYSLPQNGRESK